jgi:hypothetical protein
MSVIWQGEPPFGEDELQGATRYKIGDYWVDWNEEGEPTLEMIEKIFNPVPQSVTMRQARLALLGSGLLDTVTSAINSLPSPQKEAAQIEWQYSQEVHRNKTLVSMLMPALGLNDAQVDALFVAASQL